MTGEVTTEQFLNGLAKRERVLGESGICLDKLMRLPKHLRDNVGEYIGLNAPKVAADGLLTPMELAKLILGTSFIGPEDIMANLGVTYTDEQVTSLVASFPSLADVLWCRDNGAQLRAAPSVPLNLLEVRSVKSDTFYVQEGGWYAHPDQHFAREEKTPALEWMIDRAGIVPNSTSKTWDEQQELLTDGEFVPNAARRAWVLLTSFEIHGERLTADCWARTSSVDADGDRVRLELDADGLGVDAYWDDDRSESVGLSAARNLKLAA